VELSKIAFRILLLLKERKSIYIALFYQTSQTWIPQFYLQITPSLPFLRKRSPDVATPTEVADILLLIYRPRKDERLSWPGWLTYSWRFTHISDYPSAAGRAQNRESSPAKDRRSTTEPRNQPRIAWIVDISTGFNFSKIIALLVCKQLQIYGNFFCYSPLVVFFSKSPPTTRQIVVLRIWL